MTDMGKTRERLCEMAMIAKRDDRLEDREALIAAIKLIDEERLEREIPREDGETLVGRFVSNVGYDYIMHKEKHTARIHPDFSEDTKILWGEIESRMQTPKCLNFNREAALAEIDDLRKRQDEILSSGGIAPDASWRVGIIHGLNGARRVVEKYTTAEVENEDKG